MEDIPQLLLPPHRLPCAGMKPPVPGSYRHIRTQHVHVVVGNLDRVIRRCTNASLLPTSHLGTEYRSTLVLRRSGRAQILAMNPRPSTHCESRVEWTDVAIQQFFRSRNSVNFQGPSMQTVAFPAQKRPQPESQTFRGLLNGTQSMSHASRCVARCFLRRTSTHLRIMTNFLAPVACS